MSRMPTAALPFVDEPCMLAELEAKASADPGAARDRRGRVYIELRGMVMSHREFGGGWRILNVQDELSGRLVVCTGVAETTPGGVYSFRGVRETHPRFGDQLRIETWSVARPRSVEGIRRYLSSGLVPQMGGRRATQLVDALGEQTLDVLDGPEAEALAAIGAIPGMTPARAHAALAAWRSRPEESKILCELQGLGLTARQARLIHTAYGDNAMEALRTDPYSLSYDVDGFGFLTSDAIARRAGIGDQDPRRARAGVVFVFEKAAEDGHTWLPQDELLQRAAGTRGSELRLARTEVEAAVQELLGRERPPIVSVRDGAGAAMSRLFAEEDLVAQVLGAGARGGRGVRESADHLVDAYQLTPEQATAVAKLTASRVGVMTGGPGVGKTYTLKALLSEWTRAGERVYLAAPTGKAAIRMEESTGRAAKTIHRLLEYHPIDGFRRNETEPLEPGHIVIDEASMVDVPLMAALCRALRWEDHTLTLVGDVDQLPSVGPGAVLRDVIASGVVPVARLTRIMRQAEGSAIITSAHAINAGRVPESDNARFADWQWLDYSDETEAATVEADLVRLIVEELPALGFDPRRDVQVLTPMHKRALGVASLNERLGTALNPPCDSRAELVQGKKTYRTGDRVIQIRNDYSLGVYNGEVGFIVDASRGRVVVDFGDPGAPRFVEYARDTDREALSPAWALTVHKCVAPNTLVETAEGLLPISRLQELGTVATPRGPRPFSALVSNPSVAALHIETKDGYQLTATPDHGVDVWDGAAYVRREARDVRPGDTVRLRLGVTVDPVGPASLPPAEGENDPRTWVYAIPTEMSEDFAEFLGLMVADGTVYKAGFRLGKRYKDLVDWFAELCLCLFGVSASRSEVPNFYTAEVNSVFLARWFLSLGGLAPKAKMVPEAVLRSPLAMQAAFLRGLFADGTVNIKGDRVDHVEWSTVYPELERTVRVMLLRFGIISGRSTIPGRVYIYGANAATFGRLIGFVERAKQSRLELQFPEERRYIIPVTKAEASLMRRTNNAAVSIPTWQNMRIRGAMSRHTAQCLVDAIPGPETDFLRDRLCYHHSTVATVTPTECESWCLTVPDGHQFLQNGFAGWNSQGSQFPIVVVPVHHTHWHMWSRQLLYTAVTRAQQAVLLLGTERALRHAVETGTQAQRNTLLEAALRSYGGEQ